MGWSCAKAAGDKVDAILKANNEESQNTWTNENGVRAFFEYGREQADGSITGTVYKFVDATRVVPAGSVKVNADGKVVRFPLLSKAMRKAAKSVIEKPAMFQVI